MHGGPEILNLFHSPEGTQPEEHQGKREPALGCGEQARPANQGGKPKTSTRHPLCERTQFEPSGAVFFYNV
jgi:hypothetical protein